MGIEFWQIVAYVISFLIIYISGIVMYKKHPDITEGPLMFICGFSVLPVVNTVIVVIFLLSFPVIYFANRKR